jgi:hypothetical protein
VSERVLFSAQKNEGPFLLEWVAYHRVIGFDRIVVVSNDCEDGSDDLLDRLADAGVVDHLRQVVPPGIAPQANAERTARTAGLFRNGDWMMWLDADEFLLPSPPHRKVTDMIDALDNNAALMVAWRFFGDSHHQTWPGRHVSADFTWAAKRRRGQNAQVKTLFRYGPEIKRLDIHRPILADGITRQDFPVLTSAGTPADDRFYDPSHRPFNRLVAEPRPYILGQVAHFSVRTPDMYARKALRGDGYYADPQAVPRTDDLYAKRNFNHVQEGGLAEHAPATAQEMARLLDDPAVLKACRAISGFQLGFKFRNHNL